MQGYSQLAPGRRTHRISPSMVTLEFVKSTFDTVILQMYLWMCNIRPACSRSPYRALPSRQPVVRCPTSNLSTDHSRSSSLISETDAKIQSRFIYIYIYIYIYILYYIGLCIYAMWARAFLHLSSVQIQCSDFIFVLWRKSTRSLYLAYHVLAAQRWMYAQ